jgi:AbiEi antitoxin C-terminal domain
LNSCSSGTIKVSTPDTTAFDLIGYEVQIGGLNAVATILAELAAKLDADKLAALAPLAPHVPHVPHVPMPWAQRLGYLLERINEAPKAKLLKDYVRKHTHEAAALVPSGPVAGHPRDPGWKLVVNADVEAFPVMTIESNSSRRMVMSPHGRFR